MNADASSLRGLPIVGTPAEGQVLAYDSATRRLVWADPGGTVPLGAFQMVWRGELDGDRRDAPHGTEAGYNAGDVVHYGTPETEGLYIVTGPNLLEGGSLLATVIEVPIIEAPATRAPDVIFRTRKTPSTVLSVIDGAFTPEVLDSDSSFMKFGFPREILAVHLTFVGPLGEVWVGDIEVSAELPAHVLRG